MFEQLMTRLRAEREDKPVDNEIRLAVAALLVAADRADISETALEHTTIEDALISLYLVSREEANDLIHYGAKVEDSCSDITQVTKLIQRHMSRPERERLLSEVWEVLVSDAEAGDREQSFAGRLTPLLGLTPQEAERARQSVIARHLDP